MPGQKTTIRQAGASGESAVLRIRKLGCRTVHSNPRKVLLTHLSTECLRFRTPLWLPPQEAWTVSLNFVFEGIPLEVVGLVTHAAEDGGWWTYEIDLDGQPVMRAIVGRLLQKRFKSRAPLRYKYRKLK